MTAQELEFRELFDTMSVPIGDSTNLVATTFDNFKLVAERLLQLGYYRGYKQSTETTEAILAQVLNPQS